MNVAELPDFDLPSIQALVKSNFEIVGEVQTLAGERDLNVLVRVVGEPAYVLKIFNAAENPQTIELENEILIEAHVRELPTPKLVLNRSGDRTTEVISRTGLRHWARLVSYRPGRPLAEVRFANAQTWSSLGERVAEIRKTFSKFQVPELRRDFQWNLDRGTTTISNSHAWRQYPLVRPWIETILKCHADRVQLQETKLPSGLVHGDLNEHNLFFESLTPFDGGWRLTGIIDFGDMNHSTVINDLAIALAYAILDRSDPLKVATQIVKGYHNHTTLSEPELDVVWGKVLLRLAVSLCLSLEQQPFRPDDDYLSVSWGPICRSLPELLKIPYGFATAKFREACDMVPCQSQTVIVKWLAGEPRFPNLFESFDPNQVRVLNVNVNNPELELTGPLAMALNTGRSKDAPSADRDWDVGGYGEPRLVYANDQFAGGSDNPYSERRTIHLGVDIMAPAGTDVHLPMAGIVHDVRVIDKALDYGGVVLIQHEIPGGPKFYTLYGHLQHRVVRDLAIGDGLLAGMRVGTLGDENENGGWAPHLHFQVFCDELEMGCGLPGVGRASDWEVWKSICIDPNLILRIPILAAANTSTTHTKDSNATVAASTSLDQATDPATNAADSSIARRRERSWGRSVRTSYQQPLHIVRGWMQYLYSESGGRYLDGYNNVPHLGHAHPAMVATIHRQSKLLNTNTRYLNSVQVELAEALGRTFPDPLKVCFFLNSASEANELALRLARTFTGRRDVLVLDAAYHGHTTSLIDISPYKHAGPGGSGPPEWVHVLPLPDDYRGEFKRSDPQAGEKYAKQVVSEIESRVAKGRLPGAFIAETCPSVGGQLFLPPGYLQSVYSAVRQIGGVCIADEVQTGYGRIGSHFYAFEDHQVIPDMVVLGKPIGNGYPLAAVVTTPEIAAAFDNGMEFFSTFGGSTLACAVGLAVLRELTASNLQQQAFMTGERIRERLIRLPSHHEHVGDVRGRGLFWGIELVRDRDTLEPADVEASFVVNRLKDRGILIGTDGPFHNVLKIRPPMPFDSRNADELIDQLTEVLTEIPARIEMPCSSHDDHRGVR